MKDKEIPPYRRTSGLGGVTENKASHTIGGAKVTNPEKKHRGKKSVTMLADVMRKPGKNKNSGHVTQVYDANIFLQVKEVSKRTGMSLSSVYKVCFNYAKPLIKQLLSHD